MALYLALETSSSICSVAISNDSQLLSANHIDLPNSHSTQLMLLVKQTLNEAKVSSKQIDCVVVNDGPGSYTGLRIGCATAKGLCYTSKAQLIAVNPLKVLAQTNFNEENACYSIIHARKNEAYRCVFDKANKEVSPLEVLTLDDILKEIRNHKSSLTITCLQNDFLKEKLDNECSVIWKKPLLASDLITCATEIHAQKGFADIAYYEPNYHRLPVGVLANK